MAEELWDLTDIVERMAVAMWAHEAWRSGSFTVSQARTLESFRNESSDLRGKWTGLASAAWEAAFYPPREGQVEK